MSFDPRIARHDVVANLPYRERKLRIVKTTQTPCGQILDWIPIESQSSSGKIASPPPMKILPPIHESRPVTAVCFELEDSRVERGPAGTVPIIRSTATTLQRSFQSDHSIQKRGGFHANRRRSNQQATDPAPSGYFHCINGETGTNYGADGILSVWAPSLDLQSTVGEDHTLSQFWLQSYEGGATTSIEGGWTVDRGLNGDLKPHLFTFYTTNGYSAEGDGLGGYNNQQSGFIQYSSVVAPGALIHGASIAGGEQFFLRMKFQMYAEPITGQLNWWVGVQGSGSFIWIGYYPASLFAGGLGSGATWVGSGGEVYSSLADPSSTTIQMGSGVQADAGWAKAAFQSNLLVQTDLNGTMADSNGSCRSESSAGSSISPYTIQSEMGSGTSWGSYIYFGGPTSTSAVADLFDRVTFKVVTGVDHLCGASSATATVNLPNGAQTFVLKNEREAGWESGSSHEVCFSVGDEALPFRAFGTVSLALFSHHGVFESAGSWDIQGIEITLTGPYGSKVLLTRSGRPFARLTASDPSATL